MTTSSHQHATAPKPSTPDRAPVAEEARGLNPRWFALSTRGFEAASMQSPSPGRSPSQRRAAPQLHSVAPRVQRKSCGPDCQGTCPTCSAEPELELERPSDAAQPRGLAPSSDPAERQADEIGDEIAADLGSETIGEGPLPARARSIAESHLGVDLSGTRLLGGPSGHARAADERALAVTEGSVISFRRGQLTSARPEGRRLIGHELTHVAQQRSHATALPQRFGLPSLDDLENAVGAIGDVAEGAFDGAVEIGSGLAHGAYEVGSGVAHGAYEVGSGVAHGAYEVGSGVAHGAYEVGSGVWHGDPLGGLERGAGEVFGGVDRGVGEVADGLGRGVGEVVGGVERGVGEVAGGVERGVGAYLSGWQRALERYGIHVDLTAEGLVIEIDDITLLEGMDVPIVPGPNLAWFFPFHPPAAWMVGPIPMAGALGLMVRVQPSLMGSLGPGLLRNIRIVINPFGASSGTGELYLAAALGPRLIVSGALSGQLAAIIPATPPIPIVAGVEGGIRGTGRASALGSVGLPVTLAYSNGSITLDIDPTLQLALHLMLDVDAYAAVSLYGRIMCEYVWNLLHLEGGPAGQVSLPIHVGFDGWRPVVEIGDFDWGWIPIEDIEHAIEGTTPGGNCDGWDAFKEELCEEGVLPPEWCEGADEDEGEADDTPGPTVGPHAGLSYPGDCDRKTLIRYAENCGLTIKEGGKHTKVYNGSRLVTTIPRTVKPNGTCRSIIRDLLNECEGGSAGIAATWNCKAKCGLVSAGGSNCTGYVTGHGSGNTQSKACKAAKKNASSQAPRGCRTKHCKCDCSDR